MIELFKCNVKTVCKIIYSNEKAATVGDRFDIREIHKIKLEFIIRILDKFREYS